MEELKYKKRIKLLDCTLRDGGSVNNWKFGHKNIIHILQALNDANIDIIETGFLQNSYENSYDLSITDNIKSFDEKLLQINNKHFKAVAMINIEKFDIKKLPEKNKTLIDGIRLMFKKKDLKSAIECSNIIKDKGFSLSLNPVSVTTYEEEDIKILCETANKFEPEIVYIIDTYGLMDSSKTLSFFHCFDKYLKSKIELGYHAHNNMQLAFSNSIEILNTKAERNIVIDGSLYGMGKRAGNTPTELLAHYLNTNIYSNYNLQNITEVIENIIIPMSKQYEWGYSLIHYIAAINGCHSDYVSYLYKEKAIKLCKIDKILKLIPKDKKLSFDKNFLQEFKI